MFNKFLIIIYLIFVGFLVARSRLIGHARASTQWNECSEAPRFFVLYGLFLIIMGLWESEALMSFLLFYGKEVVNRFLHFVFHYDSDKCVSSIELYILSPK